MSSALSMALVVLAYFMGSIPFGYLIAKKRGVDVRSVGSGNIGATNVARSLGKKIGFVVLILDALKAALPTLFARIMVERGELEIVYLAAIAIAAVVGHCYPLWLRFRGGKGVATSLGVFLVIDPALTGVGALIFASLYAVTRLASVGSVAAAAAFPVMLWYADRDPMLVQLGIAIAAIIIIKHRSNLLRIIQGSENKV